MSECDNYSNDIFGGNPYKITVGGVQYPSKIEVSLCYGMPGILQYPEEEITYVPVKTSKISIQANAYGELLPCKCIKCRNEIKPWDNYCSKCGAKLVIVSTSDTTYPQYWESIDEEKSE